MQGKNEQKTSNKKSFSLNFFQIIYSRRIVLFFLQGDSGGPLIVNDLVVGITSFSFDNGCAGGALLPQVFTRVSEYFDWIEHGCYNRFYWRGISYLFIYFSFWFLLKTVFLFYYDINFSSKLLLFIWHFFVGSFVSSQCLCQTC